MYFRSSNVDRQRRKSGARFLLYHSPIRPSSCSVTAPLHRVKGCDDCRCAFVDTTKNNSRRWCSIDECGKEAKMARYIAKRATRTRAARRA
jgi:predicted RNA-binding Zn ribbon-like protein